MKKMLRKKIGFLCCVLCASFLAGSQYLYAGANDAVPDGLDRENLLENGSFSSGAKGWDVFTTKCGDGSFAVVDGAGVLSIKDTGLVDYSVQLYYDGFELKECAVYRISFDIKSTLPRKGTVRIQLNGGDYRAYFEKQFEISPETGIFSFTFTMKGSSDRSPRFCFNLGTPRDEEDVEPHDIIIDNVILELVDDSNVVADKEEDKMLDINVNQLGYLVNDTKKAVLRGESVGDTFQVLDEAGVVVFEGPVTGPVKNKTADEINYYADFSDVTEAGTYTIVSGGDGTSYPFVISDGVYDALMKSVVKMLYLQRCGEALDTEYAGAFAHRECHTSEATIYGTKETKEVTGGWHDAGDYGRYVGPGAITVADLFLAYEDFPDVFAGEKGDACGIPESGNGIPDILDEAKYELDWMLKMQDPSSGGVYHKVTCKSFPGFIPPEDETEELILSPISTTATGAFAAVMAKSARIYKDIDAVFAERCLQAAVLAWAYLEQHENTGGFTNPSDIVTGEYGDTEDADERFWAVAELLTTSKDQKYADYIKQQLGQNSYQGFGWADVGMYANIACLNLPEGVLSDGVVEKIKEAVINKADEYLALSKTDGYGISLGDDYMWGSNMAVCNYARHMLLANALNPNAEYLDAATAHFHYLLGVNPMSICYVSGFGTVSPENPHHRMSCVVGKAMPGMLIGGPDCGLHDPCTKQLLKDAPPAKCYVDNVQSYSANEITIYWNSPFIYLLAQMISK
ncbi:MAG: glycoside hydrolase [Spartobacteria bacterium]|nr:glycoside hydrolase [Spartobacteria bacterium]